MKIEVIREGSGTYRVRASATVRASHRSVLDMFLRRECTTKFRDVKGCPSWEPQADGSVLARYEMKPPSIDFDMHVRKRDSHAIEFWTPPDVPGAWCDIRGAWKVHPVFFGLTHVSLDQTILIKSAWLRMIPIQSLIKGRIKNAFEDMHDSNKGFFGRLFSCLSSSS
jgi:hypothetical protein